MASKKAVCPTCKQPLPKPKYGFFVETRDRKWSEFLGDTFKVGMSNNDGTIVLDSEEQSFYIGKDGETEYILVYKEIK